MSSPGSVLRPHAPAVRLGEAAGDREAETGAAPAGAAPPERLEQGLALLGRQAGAAVDDVDTELRRTALRPHDHSGAGRRVVERVVQQVREDTLDLRRVDLDGRRLRRDVE